MRRLFMFCELAAVVDPDTANLVILDEKPVIEDYIFKLELIGPSKLYLMRVGSRGQHEKNFVVWDDPNSTQLKKDNVYVRIAYSKHKHCNIFQIQQIPTLTQIKKSLSIIDKLAILRVLRIIQKCWRSALYCPW
mmetsp:Transcript_41289/g.41907  ORF Transcript_41289/g.41907 Transcript_41289/m.41907 type:complete len:134 (-) Transcript_41289:680-1081(-)